MVERCWKDVKGYWKNVGRIFEGCWKNGNEDDNENEVYEGLR